MLGLNARKMNMIVMLGVLISLIVMNPTISQATPNNYKIAAGYGVVDIAITNDGIAKIDITSMDLYNTNLTIFDIAPDTGMYVNLHSLGVTVGADQQEFVIALEYKGDVKNNATVNLWATSIRDKVKSYFALTYSNEQFLSAYSESNNATDFTWTYTVTCTNEVMLNLVKSISTSLMQSTFVEFFQLTSDWTFETMAFWFTKNSYEVNATGMSFLDLTAKKLVFSGDGIHIFNLTEIYGYSAAPFGVSYAVMITLPYDAALNESTVNAGNATVSTETNSLTVMVNDNQYIGDLTFAFKYNFTQPSSGTPPENNTSNNTPDNESNNPSSGSETPQGTEIINNIIGMMGGTSTVAIIGVAALAVVFGIVKVLLRRK